MLLNDSLKHSIHMIDAFLIGRQFGTLIVDDSVAYLQLPIGELIKLNDSFEIEVINDSEYISITYEQAIHTMSSDGWSLYAGLDCRVRQIQKINQKGNLK